MSEGAKAITEKLGSLLGPKAVVGHATVTLSGVTSIVSSIPTDSTSCFIAVESTETGIAIRTWEDGVDPTTTDGLPYSNLDRFDINGRENMLKFKAIAAQAGTHTLQIQFYR